jgi:uncharacterized protein (TIGR02246 family)
MGSLVLRLASAAIALPALLPLPATAAEDDAVRSVLAEQTTAWNQHDAKAWTKDFTADVDFINILGMLFQGREEFEKRHAGLFGSIFKDSQLVVTVQKVRFLSPTSAVAETVHELRGYSRLPPGIPPTDSTGLLRTRMKYVFVQAAGKWLIVSAKNTAISPPRQ